MKRAARRDGEHWRCGCCQEADIGRYARYKRVTKCDALCVTVLPFVAVHRESTHENHRQAVRPSVRSDAVRCHGRAAGRRRRSASSHRVPHRSSASPPGARLPQRALIEYRFRFGGACRTEVRHFFLRNNSLSEVIGGNGNARNTRRCDVCRVLCGCAHAVRAVRRENDAIASQDDAQPASSGTHTGSST